MGRDIEIKKTKLEKKGDLEKLAEDTFERIEKLWDGFSEFVIELPVAKYLAPIMPALKGINDFFAALFKKEKKEEAKEKPEEETKTELATLAGTIIPTEKEPEVTMEEIGQIVAEIKPQKQFKHTEVESAPFERGLPPPGKEKGTPLCSRTGFKNLRMMGGFVEEDFFSATEGRRLLAKGEKPKGIIPVGHAHDVESYYILANIKKYTGRNEDIHKQLKEGGENLVDLVVKSQSYTYEHRAVAFLSNVDGQWYVLDPYQRGATTKPILFEKYIKKANIKIAVPLKIEA